MELKYYVDFNTSFADTKFFNIIFQYTKFNLNKEMYRTFYLKRKK